MKRPLPLSATMPFVFGILATGCLPIPVTYRDTPDIEGVYRAPDGMPIPNAPVLVTTGYTTAPCTAPSAVTTTDSTGAFHLPETKHRERFIILLPIDRFPQYHVCLTVRDSVRNAYRGGSIGAAPARAMLECFQWTAVAEPRATCTDRFDAAVVRGGQWQADGESGHYRFVSLIDPGDATRRVVLAQWIAGPSTPRAHTIRATVDLATVASMFGLAIPDIFAAGDRWQVRLRGAKDVAHPYTHDVVLEMGPPGEVRLVSSTCNSNLLRDVVAAQRRCR